MSQRETYPVIPVVTGEDWMEDQPSVGDAASLSEARELIKDAGYRIMWAGGLHELSHDDEWRITVHPE